MSDAGISAHVSFQWIVQSNTIFQQVVITNNGSSPIEDFSTCLKQNMLIRDLDYLDDPSYNEIDSKGYTRGRGPNGFSWITANVFDSEKIAAGRENESRANGAPRASEFNHVDQRVRFPGAQEETSENKQLIDSAKSTGEQDVRPHTTPDQNDSGRDLSSGDVQNAAVVESSIKKHESHTKEDKAVEQSEAAPPSEAKRSPSDDEMWQKRRISDTWSAKDAHAVVSITSLYVNGTAEKMELGTKSRISKTIGARDSSSSVLEITVAYKMIVIPKIKAHWKNFLIPSGMTDVSAMLATETEHLWGHTVTDDCNCDQSLCDMGLSMVDPTERDADQDASEKGQTLQNPGHATFEEQKNTAVHGAATNNATSQVDVMSGETLSPVEPPNEQSVAQDTSTGSTFGDAVATSQKLSPRTSIEYLTWRHTEHILSVCTIPLGVPRLSLGEGRSEPTTSGVKVTTNRLETSGAQEGIETEYEVPIALTCGDMSGHRICTSASL